MKATCVLCDKKDDIHPYSLTAKKLQKRRIQSYICEDCYDRIAKSTEEKRLKKAADK